jgi:hypothetical protein
LVDTVIIFVEDGQRGFTGRKSVKIGWKGRLVCVCDRGTYYISGLYDFLYVFCVVGVISDFGVSRGGVIIDGAVVVWSVGVS